MAPKVFYDKEEQFVMRTIQEIHTGFDFSHKPVSLLQWYDRKNKASPMSQALEKLGRLQKRQDDRYKRALIHNLPEEILMLVFDMLMAMDPDCFITLAAACLYWQELLLRTPVAWSHWHLDLNDPEIYQEVPFLIQLSRSTTLDVRVDVSTTTTYILPAQNKVTCLTLCKPVKAANVFPCIATGSLLSFANAGELQLPDHLLQLELTGFNGASWCASSSTADDDFTTFKSHTGGQVTSPLHFPLLVHLVLSCDITLFGISGCPSLQTLQVAQIHHRQCDRGLVTFWNNMVSLKARVDDRFCMEQIVRFMPTLVHLEVSSSTTRNITFSQMASGLSHLSYLRLAFEATSSAMPPSDLHESLIFSAVQTLHLSGHDYHTAWTLRNCNFPSLTVLHIDPTSDYLRIGVASVTSFVQSYKNLTSLTSSCGINFGQLSRKCTRSLRYISLHSRFPANVGQPDLFLKFLSPYGRSVLPHLEVVELGYYPTPWAAFFLFLSRRNFDAIASGSVKRIRSVSIPSNPHPSIVKHLKRALLGIWQGAGELESWVRYLDEDVPLRAGFPCIACRHSGTIAKCQAKEQSNGTCCDHHSGQEHIRLY